MFAHLNDPPLSSLAKAYIDAQIAAAIAAYVSLSAYTNEDSEGNALLENHAYLAATGGMVCATIHPSGTGEQLYGFVGLTNDPAGVGDQVQYNSNTSAVHDVDISFLVAEGEYFEVVGGTGTNLPTIFWKSFGTLSKPIDQD